MSFISVDPSSGTKIKALVAKLAKFANVLADDAVDAAAQSALETMQEYAEQKSVTRKAAYGRSFFTAKQQRYFFWALKNGIIDVPYHRTNTLKGGWRIEGKGRNARVTNSVPYAGLVMGDGQQSRMHQMIGWETPKVRMQGKTEKLVRRVVDAVNKLIKKLGL